MTPNWFDHVVAITLVVVLPFEGRATMRRLTAALARGDQRARSREYGLTIALEWGLVAVVLAVWLGAGRNLAGLGLTLGSPAGAVAGGIITGIAVTLLMLQWRAILRIDPEGRAQLAAQFGDSSSLIPRNRREAAGFGLAHWYQGRVGVLKTGLLGGLMATFYLGTGSLLWPAILHVAIDLQGGAVGRRVLQDPGIATS